MTTIKIRRPVSLPPLDSFKNLYSGRCENEDECSEKVLNCAEDKTAESEVCDSKKNAEKSSAKKGRLNDANLIPHSPMKSRDLLFITGHSKLWDWHTDIFFHIQASSKTSF